LPLLSTRSLLPKAETSDLPGQSDAATRLMRCGEAEARDTMRGPNVAIAPDRLTREQLIYEAALLVFCDPLRPQTEQLLSLSGREWRRLLYWLDMSGLALYFLDRLTELRRETVLPRVICERLRQNLMDNTQRTRGMIAESVSIQREFQKAGLSYATLKGFTLWPISVPKPELRHQFDLDFLIAQKSAVEAREILERKGYRLYVISGKSWEFKINERPSSSLNDLYKDGTGHAVELHIEADEPGRQTRLDRIAHREFCGIAMPVLSPADLFLGQGLHGFKDVCSAFSRTAHLLEFRRHVLARYDDEAFWREVQLVAGGSRRAALGLGVVTYLIGSVMGEFAPEALTKWTVDTLPPTVRLWVDLYGRRTVYGKTPGSKLYLLLEQVLESEGLPAKRSLKTVLLPSRLPPIVIRGYSDEKLSIRMARYRLQLRVILSRLYFHLVEGLRYASESHRWRQQVSRLARR
jgi:Uncharacterised nucleotidyltransferase